MNTLANQATRLLEENRAQAAQIEALTESLAWAMGNLRPGLDDRCGVHEYYKARAAIAAVGEKK